MNLPIARYLSSIINRSAAFGRSLLLTLLGVSALFCACFAFDTLGDSHGWRTGLGASAALLGASLCLMLGYYYCSNRCRNEEGGGGLQCCSTFCALCVEGGTKDETTKSIIEMRRSGVVERSDALTSTENPLVVQLLQK